MKKLFTWLVYSSENPANFSLTLKGAALTILPVALLLANQLGFSLDGVNVEQFVLSVITVCTTGITLIGAIRKVINTFSETKTVAFQVPANKLSPTKKVAPKKK